ncbi:hypothetical protein ACFSFY_08170 [Sporosarcina siberiensis]|uniref:Aspartate/glutamate racemase family protein n=1 Tax=Sporosarcina siberiensis TaxID=1365606 RepID=A0ABW4SH59_9BACL
MSKPVIGILMLNTSFHRPIGDIGNPSTFTFPVAYERIEAATIERVVKVGDSNLIQHFIAAAKRLQEREVKAITTSCGFLALFQKEIQRELDVPFYASSLLQIPIAYALTGRPVGIITARKASLTKQHLLGVDAGNIPVVIEGMDDMPNFTDAIIDQSKPLNMEQVAIEIKTVTKRMINSHPEIKAILLECTNMPPYIHAMREVTDLPIFDLNKFTNYVVESLA